MRHKSSVTADHTIARMLEGADSEGRSILRDSLEPPE